MGAWTLKFTLHLTGFSTEDFSHKNVRIGRNEADIDTR
jgi:hypothetical protein